ncbi:MAG: DUF2442 domain-containing protein [Prevotellaceae bacterium]|jgi:hypothetical protein|nr:DUF2442 domain-containing protein [Prevotellaceae bacterium]
MFLEVTNAKYLDSYRLLLTFNNGEQKTVDLQNELNGSAFAPLRQLDYFKKFRIKYNTVEWENGADYAPEYLYEIGLPKPIKSAEK